MIIKKKLREVINLINIIKKIFYFFLLIYTTIFLDFY